MDKKSKIVVGLFIFTVVFLFSYEFYRIFVEQDYVINAHIPCDPTRVSCFAYVCPEGEEADCDDEVFARITKNISDVELCNQYVDECADLACSPGEDGCEIVYCTEENRDEDQVCVETPAPEPIEEIEPAEKVEPNEV